jgi:hypothetical protein
LLTVKLEHLAQIDLDSFDWNLLKMTEVVKKG